MLNMNAVIFIYSKDKDARVDWLYYLSVKKNGETSEFICSQDQLKHGCAEYNVDAKSALNKSLLQHDVVAFERLFSVIEGDIQDEILNDRLWDIYADRQQLDRSTLDDEKKGILYCRLRDTVSDYFQKNFFQRSPAHMNQVMMSYLSLIEGGQRQAQSDVLNQYVSDMPFAVQSRYYRHTKGPLGEALLWMKHVAASVLFVVLMRSGFSYLFDLYAFFRILPTIFGFSTAMMGQTFAMLSWVLPGAFISAIQFIGGIITTVGLVANLIISPFLFLAAWVAVFKFTGFMFKAGFQNLFADPPDFNPVNIKPLLCKVISPEVNGAELTEEDIRELGGRHPEPSAPPATHL
jgi:hypothetical protein